MIVLLVLILAPTKIVKIFLREISINIDKSFVGALNAQERKQLKGLDELEKKLIKAEKRNYETQINNVKSIFESLHQYVLIF